MSPARVKKEKRDVADVEGEPLIYEKTLMKNYLQFLLIFSRPGFQILDHISHICWSLPFLHGPSNSR